MRLLFCPAALMVALTGLSVAQEPTGPPPKDSRLGKPKDYNGYFPWTAPKDLQAWKKRRQEVREQVLVATGLWPMPKKTPLNPVIHGKIDRAGYSVEKVFFASYPGFYVTGSLYRPLTADGKQPEGKVPGVLCPHGHWRNGRFFDALAAHGEKFVKNQITIGAEKTEEGARFPLQARCAQLARMGCVVFHYDMVGVADSTQIGHTAGFQDPEAELQQQSFMGLQTWNSIRSLDFLLSLPEVDPARIGVTGASGGGTQTFILCAIDDRPAVAFPAVMVSTGMQGGCVCENCSYLRLGTGNIELAGLFAPRPLAMSGANDWTKKIETDGLPQLKELYRLYGAEDKVAAKAWLKFDHNYNQVSREFMYNWFNKHLKLGHKEPVTEAPFAPIVPKELSVYDAEHPRPKDAVDIQGLRRYMTQESERQREDLFPKDAKGLAELRRVAGTALRVMINDRLPSAAQVESNDTFFLRTNGREIAFESVGRKRKGEDIPIIPIGGPKDKFGGTVIVLIHPEGSLCLEKDRALNRLVHDSANKNNVTFLVPDLFLTGRWLQGENRKSSQPRYTKGYAGYVFGYNRTFLADRIHDILTTVAYARSLRGVKKVHLVGFGKAGPWVVLARALCGDAVDRTAADLDQFRFEKILSMDDEMLQPGALKYGGIPVLSALCSPHELYLHNTKGTGTDRWLRAAYQIEGHPERLERTEGQSTPEEVVRWLLR
jgi:dienelactone hydrolase